MLHSLLLVLLGAPVQAGSGGADDMSLTQTEGPSREQCDYQVFNVVNSCGGRTGDPEHGPRVMGMETSVSNRRCAAQVECLGRGLDLLGPGADDDPSTRRGRIALLLRQLSRTVGAGARARGQWIRELNTILRAIPAVGQIREQIHTECGEGCTPRSLAHFRTTGVSSLPDLLDTSFCGGRPATATAESYGRFVQAVERYYQQTLVGCGRLLGVPVSRDGDP